MRPTFRHLLISLITLFLLPAVNAQSVLPENFDTFVTEGMEQWEIPGIAVAVVKDGDIAFTGGFGVLKLGESAPVDENSLFGIASVSKHITASSLAILVDEGKIKWDDPVIKHIPWFRLSDPWATEHVTIHDLLTHQVGVGRVLGNRLQFMTNRSREELLYRLRYHDFEQPFRSSYVYSNVMYTLAGEIVEAVTGVSWDEFIKERFFEPLGMNRTHSSYTKMRDESNAAWPHQYIEGSVVPIPRRSWDVAAPAGGINSTAADMARWMIMQLNQGKFQNTQYLSPASLHDIQTPKIALPVSSVEADQRSYGYGFNITDYNGYRMLEHGGATDGMNTSYALFPELDLGIIVMTNTFTTFREAIVRSIVDHVTGAAPTDWNSIFYNSYKRQFEAASDRRDRIHEARNPHTTPAYDLQEYTGTYHHPMYDTAEITLVDGDLYVTLFEDETLKGKLEHWQHDTFRILWNNPAQREEFLKFGHGFEGGVQSATIRFTLRPQLLQVGAYPTNYFRDVTYEKR